MSFLYPQVLYGLFAVAIPIIVHLFNFKKREKIYYSNVAFLKEVQKKSGKKRKVKHLLILLFRILFIIFLVLAFAQPLLKTSNNLEKKTVTIYLDNSKSMSNEIESGISAFEAAKTHAMTIINSLPKSTSYRLITNDFDNFSITLKNKEQIQDRITKLKLSNLLRKSSSIFQRFQFDSQNNDNNEFYWISDFQESSLKNNENNTLADKTLNLVPLKFESNSNVFIDSIYFDNPFLKINKNNKINIKLVNTSNENLNRLRVKLFVNQVQVATSVININALDEKVILFEFPHDTSQSELGKVSIEEYPVIFDNEFFFIIKKNKPINILELTNNKSSNFIRFVYANKQLFNLKSASTQNIDYSWIKDYDLVILNELHDLSATLMDEIKNRLKNNGNVLLIPSSKPNIDLYKRINQTINLSNSQKEMRTLKTLDFNNPFFKNIFEKVDSRIDMPKAIPILELQKNSNSILRFKNNTPFLTKKDNLFILASPLSSDYTNFHNHAIFVPIMYSLSSQNNQVIKPNFYRTNQQNITIFHNRDSINDPNLFYTLQNDDVGKIIPEQRKIEGKTVINLSNNSLQKGFYNVMYNKVEIEKLAFNDPKAESYLKQLNNDQLSSYFGSNAKIYDTSSSNVFKKELNNKYNENTLWKYLIIFALICLLIESILIRLNKKSYEE